MQQSLDDVTVVGSLMADLLSGLSQAEMGRPTPCDGWSVDDLAGHVIDQLGALAAAGSPTSTVDDGPGDIPIRYRAAVERFLAVYRRSGALDREVELPLGTFPGRLVVELATVDQLIHYWDLGSATGRSVTCPTDLVERAMATVAVVAAAIPADAGLFKPPVDPGPGAEPLHRLVALTGRVPGWADAG